MSTSHQITADALRLAQQRQRSSPWTILRRTVGAAFAALIVGLLLTLLVVPRMFGGDSLTVLSGSMEPTFSPGDIVVVKGLTEAEVCTETHVGSIVAFFPEPNDPTLITHRIIGKTIGSFDDGTACRLITQGDANSAADEPVSPTQVRGLYLYAVPSLGWLRQWVGQNPAALAGIAGLTLIGWGVWNALRKPRVRVVTVPNTERLSTGSVEHQEREALLREREARMRERELALGISQGSDPVPAPVQAAE